MEQKRKKSEFDKEFTTRLTEIKGINLKTLDEFLTQFIEWGEKELNKE
jgi:hypothetical protein